MSSSLSWTVIGYGDFGRRHARAIRAAGHQVVAIADPDAQRRRLAAGEEKDALVTADMDAALGLAADVVVVATPEAAHRGPVVAALETSHVLVEKPIATKVCDAVAMIETAERNDRLLFVGHLLRFDPRLRALRDLVERGDFGSVVHVSSRRHGTRSSAVRYQRQRPLLLSGVHDADIARWMLDTEPTSVSATAVAPLNLQTPDHEVAMFDFGGTASAVIEAGRLLADGARAHPHTILELIGTDASASIIDGGPIIVTDADGVRSIDLVADPSASTPEGMLTAQVIHVAGCVQRSTPTKRIGAGAALTALRMMVAAVKSASEHGRQVTVQ